MKIDVSVGDDGTPEVTLSEVYSGVGVMTGMGLFGIAQRDGGLEVLHGGKTVWTSHEITEERPWRSEHTSRGTVLRKEQTAGRSTEPVRLPDGSGAFTASMPLPKDHWLYAERQNEPPMPMRVGVGPKRDALAHQIRAAANYAIRASTMNGKEKDFDPDALVQNMVVGLLGRWTEDGR